MSFSNSGWSYSTSSGVGGTLGELAEVTIQHTRLYINSPNGDTYKIIAQGVGGGVGASVLPASITGSTTDFVSAGSNIYTLLNDNLTLADMSDSLLIYSGNLTWLDGTASGSMVLFLRFPLWKIAAGLILSSELVSALAETIRGVCFIASAQLSTPNAGLDATGTFYAVYSADSVA